MNSNNSFIILIAIFITVSVCMKQRSLLGLSVDLLSTQAKKRNNFIPLINRHTYQEEHNNGRARNYSEHDLDHYDRQRAQNEQELMAQKRRELREETEQKLRDMKIQSKNIQNMLKQKNQEIEEDHNNIQEDQIVVRERNQVKPYEDFVNKMLSAYHNNKNNIPASYVFLNERAPFINPYGLANLMKGFNRFSNNNNLIVNNLNLFSNMLKRQSLVKKQDLDKRTDQVIKEMNKEIKADDRMDQTIIKEKRVRFEDTMEEEAIEAIPKKKDILNEIPEDVLSKNLESKRVINEEDKEQPNLVQESLVKKDIVTDNKITKPVENKNQIQIDIDNNSSLQAIDQRGKSIQNINSETTELAVSKKEQTSVMNIKKEPNSLVDEIKDQKSLEVTPKNEHKTVQKIIPEQTNLTTQQMENKNMIKIEPTQTTIQTKPIETKEISIINLEQKGIAINNEQKDLEKVINGNQALQTVQPSNMSLQVVNEPNKELQIIKPIDKSVGIIQSENKSLQVNKPIEQALTVINPQNTSLQSMKQDNKPIEKKTHLEPSIGIKEKSLLKNKTIDQQKRATQVNLSSPSAKTLKKIKQTTDQNNPNIFKKSEDSSNHLSSSFTKDFLQINPIVFDHLRENIDLKDIFQKDAFVYDNFIITPIFKYDYLADPYKKTAIFDFLKNDKEIRPLNFVASKDTPFELKNNLKEKYGNDINNFPNYYFDSVLNNRKIINEAPKDKSSIVSGKNLINSKEQLKHRMSSEIMEQNKIVSANYIPNAINNTPEELQYLRSHLPSNQKIDKVRSKNNMFELKKNNVNFFLYKFRLNKLPFTPLSAIPQIQNLPNVVLREDPVKEVLMDLPFYNLILDVEERCIEDFDVNTCQEIVQLFSTYYLEVPTLVKRNKDILKEDIKGLFEAEEHIVFLNTIIEEGLFDDLFAHFAKKFSRMDYLTTHYIKMSEN